MESETFFPPSSLYTLIIYKRNQKSVRYKLFVFSYGKNEGKVCICNICICKFIVGVLKYEGEKKIYFPSSWFINKRELRLHCMVEFTSNEIESLKHKSSNMRNAQTKFCKISLIKIHLRVSLKFCRSRFNDFHLVSIWKVFFLCYLIFFTLTQPQSTHISTLNNTFHCWQLSKCLHTQSGRVSQAWAVRYDTTTTKTTKTSKRKTNNENKLVIS